MSTNLGYLGPPGTFSEEAARNYIGTYRRRLVEYSTIPEIAEAVAAGRVEEGLVPLENSLEGGVAVTLDLLASRDGLQICRELIHPIKHCLLALPGTGLHNLKVVASHPQALGQCRQFLDRRLPGRSFFPTGSTAAAALKASGEKGVAAIAPRRAAALYGLDLLAEDIQDNDLNSTRFVVLADQDHLPTGDDKTSLVVAIPDGPGSLYHILSYFARYHVNLTRIESRPARRHLGEYLFFIDCQGHRLQAELVRLWGELGRESSWFKILGSYPRFC
ncbi:MAG: prephenate dehydratase [Firmicutes bacterium]|nr:prephenate dehydratase [Bacillota bacterium]